MATHTNLSSLFTAIADAIRAKTGKTETIVADNFPTEIAAIETGGGGFETCQVTVTSGDRVLYVNYTNGQGELEETFFNGINPSSGVLTVAKNTYFHAWPFDMAGYTGGVKEFYDQRLFYATADGTLYEAD